MVLPALLIGCQPTPAGPPKAVDISSAPLPTDRPPTADETVASDASATRLHDIVGVLLLYYIEHHNHMPDTLEQIKPYADVGTDLNFISPYSGQPYVYSSAGLYAAGQDRRIIIWDPVPNKSGIRWCVLMPRVEPGKPVVPEVVPIQTKAFEAFVPAID